MNLSFDDENSFKEVVGSLRFASDNPSSDPSSQDSERNEDVCFNNDSLSDSNSIGRVGRTPPQERSEDIEMIPA
jgi:hypothetical protein